MAKYLVKASYNAEGIKGVLKGGGSSRVEAVKKAIASVGGTVESFYFAFGGNDVYVTVDAPGNVAAAAMAAAVGSSGAMAHYETVVLLTADEIDEAMRVAVSYTPPGS
ncbi:MAG TPA: GYD domain-containing protein [Jatrophihabitans sp.]|nr:GYD domain-containing protein [Jatrophihabitans sp.]